MGRMTAGADWTAMVVEIMEPDTFRGTCWDASSAKSTILEVDPTLLSDTPPGGSLIGGGLVLLEGDTELLVIARLNDSDLEGTSEALCESGNL